MVIIRNSPVGHETIMSDKGVQKELFGLFTRKHQNKRHLVFKNIFKLMTSFFGISIPSHITTNFSFFDSAIFQPSKI